MKIDSRSLQSVSDQDGTVILDVEYDKITNLNATGGFVWERLQAGRTVEEAIHDLARETDMEPEVIEPDVRAFIQQLSEKRLITF